MLNVHYNVKESSKIKNLPNISYFKYDKCEGMFTTITMPEAPHHMGDYYFQLPLSTIRLQNAYQHLYFEVNVGNQSENM